MRRPIARLPKRGTLAVCAAMWYTVDRGYSRRARCAAENNCGRDTMKRGIILVNAYSRMERELHQSVRLQEEFERCGIRADVRRNNFFAAYVRGDGTVVSELTDYDFCVYLDKDKYVSQLLERKGMRLFNRHDAVVACDDKMTTSVLLADHGIPMPETLPGLLCYTPGERVADETLERVARTLGFPLVVKHCYGSLGSGVFKADDMPSLRAIAEQVKCVPHLFQRFVASSFGRDMRVLMIGGKLAAAMERRSAGDFRSNLEIGGAGKAIDPPREAVALCEKVASVLRLDYCGIDVLFGEGGFLICEVNSNAFFGGIEAVTGVNIAERYVRHISDTVYG